MQKPHRDFFTFQALTTQRDRLFFSQEQADEWVNTLSHMASQVSTQGKLAPQQPEADTVQLLSSQFHDLK